MKETTNVDIIERVARLEERVDSGMKYISEDLKDIKENHLHTLQKDVSDLKIQVNTLTIKVGIAVSVATILIDLAFRFFVR